MKTKIKEEAAKIRPAGPNQQTTDTIGKKNALRAILKIIRTKHANTNINKLCTVEDWNKNTGSEEEIETPTTTDEKELLTEESKYYTIGHIYPKNRRGGNQDPTENIE